MQDCRCMYEFFADAAVCCAYFCIVGLFSDG